MVNGDFARVIQKLVPDRLRRRWSNARIAKKKFSCSTFMLYLGVDGTFGPRTSAALSEFQSSHGIDESGIGPATLEALGVDVPDDAPIVYLRAGAWDFDY